MEITKTQNGNALTITLSGRLDTTTAPALEETIRTSVAGVTDLTLDFGQLDYISSAGLRVLLSTQKIMNRQGKMTVCHPNEDIREVFDITGFVDILTIED